MGGGERGIRMNGRRRQGRGGKVRDRMDEKQQKK
jgi:hypothetical protein